jgi:heat shock protein HslJ
MTRSPTNRIPARLISLALIAIAVSTTAGCQLVDLVRPPSPAPQSPVGPVGIDLASTVWTVKQIDGVDVPPEAGTVMTFEAGVVSGSTGCNSYSGQYTQDGVSIRIGTVGMTKIGCPGAVADREQAFVRALDEVRTLRRVDVGLELLDEGGRTRLLLGSGFPGERVGIEGVPWRLVAIEGIAVPAVPPMTLEMSSKAVKGSTGCNSYGGSYTLAGAQLSFGQLASTAMACLDQQVSAREAAFTRELELIRSFAVVGGQLQLNDESGGARLTFVAAP